MLKVSNLRKNYKNLEVLKDISFKVKKDSIYGFLGPNGAGKTTTMNILAGLIDYQEGAVYLHERNYSKNKREILKSIGYLPQNPTFYNYMNTYEYLSFIGKLNNLNSKEIMKRTEELIQLVGLKEAGKRKIGGYSGGMKQRLGLAIALFHKPKLLLLDEPTSALDPGGRQELLEFIKGLPSQGTTVFLSTHILNDVERICDEVSILNKGSIVLSDTLQNLKDNYIQPIFDIEFECIPNDLKFKIQNIKWIENIIIEENKVSIYVNDVQKAKYNLLNLLYKDNHENIITSYNLRKSNLEDVFVRMVNSNVNI